MYKIKTLFKKFPSESEIEDLRYIFNLFYKHSPGSIKVYQTFRFYLDEYPEQEDLRDNFFILNSIRKNILNGLGIKNER